MVEQKYTKGKKLPYDVDDWFIEQIRDIPMEYAFDIVAQMVKEVGELPKKNGWTQRIAGVSHAKDTPLFFELEYLNQPEDICVFLAVEEIEVDTFLDYVIEKQTLNLNTDETHKAGREVN